MPPIVTTNLIGGFGNQLFQYAFARAYAERHGATLQVPVGWPGSVVFDLADPPIDQDLPPRALQELLPGEVNVALRGYFQNQAALDHYTRERARAWFRLRPQWQDVLAKLPARPLVAHRRDYGDSIYVNVSRNSYVLECEHLGLDPSTLHFVEEANPVLLDECTQAGVPFLPDFYTCMTAKTLLRGNSTFSWWAGALGRGRVFSPLVAHLPAGERDVEFVEGNHPKCIAVGDLTDLHLEDT